MSFSSDIKKLNKLSTDRKIILVIIFIFVFLGGVYLSIGLNLLNITDKPAPIQNNHTIPTQKPPTASYILKTDSATVTLSKPFTVSVFIEESPAHVTDVGITFDPTIFKLGKITPGTVYKNLAKVDKNIDVKKSRPGYLFVVGSVDTESPILKTGEIFIFELTPIKIASSSMIEFDLKKTGAYFDRQPILGSTNSLNIQVIK